LKNRHGAIPGQKIVLIQLSAQTIKSDINENCIKSVSVLRYCVRILASNSCVTRSFGTPTDSLHPERHFGSRIELYYILFPIIFGNLVLKLIIFLC